MNVKKFASAFMSGLLVFTYFASSAMNENSQLIGNRFGVHDKQPDEHDDDLCAVCLQSKEQSKYKYTLFCGHSYDIGCLRTMLTQNIRRCPACRSNFIQSDMDIISDCNCENIARMKLKLGERFLVGNEPNIAVLPCCNRLLHARCLKKSIIEQAERAICPTCPCCDRALTDAFLKNTLKLACQQVAALQMGNVTLVDRFTLAGPTVSLLRDKIDELKDTNQSLKSVNRILQLIIACLVIIEAYQVYQMYFTK